MKKLIFVFTLLLSISLTCLPTERAHAIVISLIIKTAVKKVIKAVDLAIQKVQTKTIKLQAAQKELENILSKAKLGEIAAWNDSSRILYSKYFQELASVKNVISYFNKVQELIAVQKSILAEYKSGYNLFTKNNLFSTVEADHMLAVYSGIAAESIQNLDELTVIITPGKTSMTDAARLDLLSDVYAKMVKNQTDLQRFNNQNAALYVQRTKSKAGIDMIKRLYGL